MLGRSCNLVNSTEKFQNVTSKRRFQIMKETAISSHNPKFHFHFKREITRVSKKEYKIVPKNLPITRRRGSSGGVDDEGFIGIGERRKCKALN
ncbi:hypothetical protein SLA2020_371930 [Shorea laevis]